MSNTVYQDAPSLNDKLSIQQLWGAKNNFSTRLDRLDELVNSTKSTKDIIGMINANNTSISNINSSASSLLSGSGIANRLTKWNGTHSLGAATVTEASGALGGITTINMSSTLTLSAMTLGSILHIRAGGVVAQDNANLFYDSTNKWLGLGTTTPKVALHIKKPAGGTTSSGIVLEQCAATDSPAYQFLKTTDTYPYFSAAVGMAGTINAWLGGAQNGYFVNEVLNGGKFCWAASVSNAGTAVYPSMVLCPDNGSSEIGGLVIGYNQYIAGTNLHVWESNADTVAALRIQQASTGDAAINFLLTGGVEWTAGIDNSVAGDPFVINNNANLSTSSLFTFTTAGALAMASLTASTLVYSDASKYIVSLANSGAASYLLNDGAGALSWVTTALSTSHALDDTARHTGGSLTSTYVPYYLTNKIVNSVISQSSDNIGIGIAVPAMKLHVYKDVDGATAVDIENPNTGTFSYAMMYLKSDNTHNAYLAQLGVNTPMSFGGLTTAGMSLLEFHSAGLLVNVYDNAPLYFGTQNIARMMIDGSGNVGIGASSPVSLLEVYSSTASPIITITGLHATNYDPQINFRTDSPATVKWCMGVDSTNDNFLLTSGTTLNAASHFNFINNGGTAMLGINCIPTTCLIDAQVTANGQYQARFANLSNGTGASFAFNVCVEPLLNNVNFALTQYSTTYATAARAGWAVMETGAATTALALSPYTATAPIIFAWNYVEKARLSSYKDFLINATTYTNPAASANNTWEVRTNGKNAVMGLFGAAGQAGLLLIPAATYGMHIWAAYGDTECFLDALYNGGGGYGGINFRVKTLGTPNLCLSVRETGKIICGGIAFSGGVPVMTNAGAFTVKTTSTTANTGGYALLANGATTLMAALYEGTAGYAYFDLGATGRINVDSSGNMQLNSRVSGTGDFKFNNGYIYALAIRSGATQAAAGASAGELWKTASHATLPDNVVMIGV